VVCVLAFVGYATVVGCVQGAHGQATEEWRTRYAAGEEARQAGDASAYAREMGAAAAAMPAGHLNRPFIQYHAARASALAGNSDDAVRWLRTAWDEGIESLMISFAPYDPAFADLLDTPGFQDVMGLAAGMELDVRPLGGSTHLLSGAGSNVLAQIGPDGVLLVDTGYGPALPALESALGGLGGSGVDVLIVTHPHEDHMGSAATLGERATVLAHPGTAAAMREPYEFMDGVQLPPKAPSALPDREISADTSFVFNGETVRVLPTVAHTTGDVSVFFEASKVAHLGDTYLAGNPMMFPGTDDPAGFLDRLQAFLDSMPPETIVVGGHEDPTDVAAVRAQIATSRACMAFVEGAVSEGLSIEETAEQGSDRFPVAWIAFFYGYFSANQGS
jgi:glyoxylase-like metal-dependent hydrolase (beta-lactamase superfamily II)